MKAKDLEKGQFYMVTAPKNRHTVLNGAKARWGVKVAEVIDTAPVVDRGIYRGMDMTEEEWLKQVRRPPRYSWDRRTHIIVRFWDLTYPTRYDDAESPEIEPRDRLDLVPLQHIFSMTWSTWSERYLERRTEEVHLAAERDRIQREREEKEAENTARNQARVDALDERLLPEVRVLDLDRDEPTVTMTLGTFERITRR